jgi:YidC/Oxa1 family membrane protein insertase
VSINGKTIDLGNVTWNLAGDNDPNAATYTLDLANAAGPVARLSKTFRVFPRDTKDRPGSGGFEVFTDYAVQNLSGGELKVKTAFNGPTLPPSEVRRGPDRQVISGYEEDQHVHVGGHIVEEFKPDDATRDLTKNKDGRPVVWSGTASVYFEGIVLPVGDKGAAPAGFIQGIRAEGLDVRKETEPADRTVATVFETSELKVPAGGQISLPLNTYFGPRWRHVLNADYYTHFPRSYNQTLVIVSGYCAICTFQWLIDVLVKMLGAFHFITRDWGLAIICLVVLVRTLLHPVTKRSQISMMKMGKMGPEMERLKKKYGDNKEELSKAMWEFQKSQGVTPILGCLPMFLQMPIWIALWSALQSTFELRQAPFLWGFTWIHDLAKPDALITFAHPLRLPFGIHVESLNILPVFLGAVFFLQQKMTPKPPAMTPEQAQQQKMMQWMSLLFPVFLYNGPSGLNLYILTSTTIGIIESKKIRDHIKQREEAEKAGGPVIIDARPTRNKKKEKDRKEPPEDPKKRGMMGWLADLQARAEEMRRQADRRGGK